VYREYVLFQKKVGGSASPATTPAVTDRCRAKHLNSSKFDLLMYLSECFAMSFVDLIIERKLFRCTGHLQRCPGECQFLQIDVTQSKLAQVPEKSYLKGVSSISL